MATKRPLPRFLQRRHRRYYAVLEIPASLRHHFPATHKRGPNKGKLTGKNLVRLVTSLETDSLKDAERRAGPIIASWRSELARLKNEIDDATFWNRKLRNANGERERKQVLEQIDIAAMQINSTYVDNPTDEEIEAIHQNTDDRRLDFYKRATGEIVQFTEHMDAYLSRKSIKDKTKAEIKYDVSRFAVAFPTVQDVTVEGVQRWIDGLDLSPKSVRVTLSAIRGYWKYLQRPDVKVVERGFLPFDGLDLPKLQASHSRRYKPFPANDVIKLLMHASKSDKQLRDLITIGMWTGCRLEEICSLQKGKVFITASIPYIEIEDAKTEAGWRQVPIHKALMQHMNRLCNDNTDRFVLSGLTANKHGDRRERLGRKFSRLKTSIGYGDKYVFHSIRKTVVTILENAGINENIVADIVGHDKPRMTYGLYSGGASLAVKADALSKLTYGK